MHDHGCCQRSYRRALCAVRALRHDIKLTHAFARQLSFGHYETAALACGRLVPRIAKVNSKAAEIE